MIAGVQGGVGASGLSERSGSCLSVPLDCFFRLSFWVAAVLPKGLIFCLFVAGRGKWFVLF